MVFYGDVDFLFDRNAKVENVLLLSNHQTTSDWMIINILAARVEGWPGPLGHVRYVMKGGLKFLPLIGFYLGTYARGGVFVKRTKDGNERRGKTEIEENGISSSASLTPLSSFEENDEIRGSLFEDEGKNDGNSSNGAKKSKTIKSLERIRQWRNESGVPTWLVLYPEGTRFDPGDEAKIDKSRRYAEINNLEPLQHVLCPRVKAVRDSLSTLGGSLDAVYHVTIAYSSTFCEDSATGVQRLSAPSMSDILMGDNPRVHVHLKRIPATDLPSDLVDDETSVRNWLHEIYAESDDRLAGFYSLDPGRRGKLLSSAAAAVTSTPSGNAIHFKGISVFKTLPAFLGLSLVMSLILATKGGRRLYWQSWLLGSPALAAAATLLY